MKVIAWSLNEKRPRNSAALKFITDHIGESNKMGIYTRLENGGPWRIRTYLPRPYEGLAHTE